MSLRLADPNITKPLQSNNGQKPVLKDIKITAKADSTGVENSQGPLFVKHHHSVKKLQTPSVARRNARERNRVKVVNSGFDVLKSHVPHLKSKVSKVETLKAAVDYIRALKEMLGEEIDDSPHHGPILIGDNEQIDDESSNFSDLGESNFSPNNSLTGSSDIQDVNLHPMVYQLPPTSTITLYPSTSNMQTSCNLPSTDKLATSLYSVSDKVATSLYAESDKIATSLYGGSSDKLTSPAVYIPVPVSSMSVNSLDIENKTPETIRLPSIAAPAWWPQPPSSSPPS